MKKALVLMMLALGGLLIPSAVFAEYDRGVVIKVMRAHLAAMGNIKKALEAKDFAALEKHFSGIAKDSASVKDFDPKKGNKEDWTKTWKDFIEAADSGVKASKAKDLAASQKAFEKLQALNKAGHAAFK